MAQVAQVLVRGQFLAARRAEIDRLVHAHAVHGMIAPVNPRPVASPSGGSPPAEDGDLRSLLIRGRAGSAANARGVLRDRDLGAVHTRAPRSGFGAVGVTLDEDSIRRTRSRLQNRGEIELKEGLARP